MKESLRLSAASIRSGGLTSCIRVNPANVVTVFKFYGIIFLRSDDSLVEDEGDMILPRLLD